MPITYLSGVTGSVSIGGVAAPFGKWEAEIKTKAIPNRNFLTAPFDDWVAGFTGATINLDMPVYPAGTLPAGTSLTSGTSYQFTLGYTGAVNLVITAQVETLKPGVDADGAPTLHVTAVSKGTFTPTVS